MPLAAGTRLGPCEIQSVLGAGGMGEVYRARDTRLDRIVAIKVLPSALADTPGFRERFEREAKTISQLNHPNICTLYDFGRDGGVDFLIMEYVDGETLDERLRRGAIPVADALPLARQIVAALEAAHERGIVHRDLKPANIKAFDGRVKVLDFGLAKDLASAQPQQSMSPTVLAGATRAGVILGTAAYMSPEQARGWPVDHRADIWAFGCVLYEMLTGRQVFGGPTVTDSLASVIHKEPAWDALPPDTPDGVRRVLRRCLEKDPKRRLRDIADAVPDLDDTASPPAGEPRDRSAASSRERRWLAAIAVALFGGVLVGFLMSPRFLATGAAHPSFTPLTYRPQFISRALFAPDGRTIVFSAARTGTRVELFALAPDYPEPRNLGLHDVQLLSVSSKNELAVLTNAVYVGASQYVGTLARTPLGGAPREVLDGVRDADWSPNGADLTIIREMSGRDRVEFPIGRVLYEVSGFLSDVRVAPDGRHVAFFEHPSRYDNRGELVVVDLTGKKTVVSPEYWGLEGLAWSRDGQEVLYSGGQGFSKFTVYGLTMSGRNRVALESAGGLVLYDVARDGRWLASRDDGNRVMMVKGPGMPEERDLSWLEYSRADDLSRDGRVLLFTETSGAAGGNTYAVCLRQTDGSPVVRLGDGSAMALSPDARWALAFVPGQRDRLMLYPTRAGESRQLDSGPVEHYSIGGALSEPKASWFPDGQRFVLCGSEVNRDLQCYVQSLEGPPHAIADHAGTAIVSPDGRHVLVRHNGAQAGPLIELYDVDGGQSEPLAGLNEGDRVLSWSPDGHSLIVSRDTIPAPLERFDLSTGRRELIRAVGPSDLTGVLRIQSIAIADDPNLFAYSIRRQLSHLFLIEGAR